ncbi:MAG: hypothetical protein HC845_07590 [Akkermansiaceae bacterium]|nr:hypothetical protein [Akkermansiaceae bacterium]NJR41627.1 hypothetical protein [Akkermansiaceae bacterium]
MNPNLFTSYQEWREAITGKCGLELDRAYCEERIAALADFSIPSTRSFLDTYGQDYLATVSSWFQRASEEAVK